jgi:hypothetical protein
MGPEFSSQAEEGRSLEIEANVGRNQSDRNTITKRDEMHLRLILANR